MILGDVSTQRDSKAGDAPGWWLSVPAWADARLAGSPVRSALLRLESNHEVSFTSRHSPDWSLLSASLELGPHSEISRVAEQMYDSVTARLAGMGEHLPVRFWNFIPSIHAPASDGLDRYRAFNIGRHASLLRWYGSREAFDQCVPTATGVGHDGRELVVHCLAWCGSRLGIENPRQRPAYRYSARFGPASPSFARATLVDDDQGRTLVIGGTASVLGEESVHQGDAAAQLEETLVNLSHLIDHAVGVPVSRPLSVMRSVRVYYVRPCDLAALRARLGQALPCEASVEFVRADICRRELLVEIEGVAALDDASGVGE